MVRQGILIKKLDKQLPRGIAAVYYFGYKGSGVPTFIVNSRLTLARRRVALATIIAEARGVSDFVTLAQIAA